MRENLLKSAIKKLQEQFLQLDWTYHDYRTNDKLEKNIAGRDTG